MMGYNNMLTGLVFVRQSILLQQVFCLIQDGWVLQCVFSPELK